MSSNAHNCNYYPSTQDFLHHIPDDNYDSDYSDNDVVAFDFNAPMAPLPGAVEDIIQNTPHLLERKSVLEQIFNSIMHIEESMHNYQPSPFQPNTRMSGTVVRGMTGVGKTVLVASCIADANILRYYSDGIVWLNLDNRSQNQKGIVDCSTALNPDFENPLSETSLTLADYRAYLHDLLCQLGLDDDPMVLSSNLNLGQTTMDCNCEVVRSIRHEYQNMIIAKNEVHRRLKNRRVLIVLDNVWWRKDPSWFDFWLESAESSHLHLLITTRNRNISTHDNFSTQYNASKRNCLSFFNVIEVPELTIYESIKLFLRSTELLSPDDEDKLLTDNSVSTFSSLSSRSFYNLKRIVKKGGCLPLTITMLGRLARSLYQYDASINDETWESFRIYIDDDDICKTCSSCSNHFTNQCYQPIFQLLGSEYIQQSLGMEYGLFKVCFVAFTIVFDQHTRCLSPIFGCTSSKGQEWIPFSVVHAFFRQLLTAVGYDNSFQVEEQGGNTFVVDNEAELCIYDQSLKLMKTIEVLGFFDVQDRCTKDDHTPAPYCYSYRVHHDLMQAYGALLAEDTEVKDILSRLASRRDRFCTYFSQPVCFFVDIYTKIVYSNNKVERFENGNNHRNKFSALLHSLLVEAVWPGFKKSNYQSWEDSVYSIDTHFFLNNLPKHLYFAGNVIIAAHLLCCPSFFSLRCEKVCGGDPEDAIRLNLMDIDTLLIHFKKSHCIDINMLDRRKELPQRLLISQMRVIRNNLPNHFSWDNLQPYLRAWIQLALYMKCRSLWLMAMDCLAEAKHLCEFAPSPENTDVLVVYHLLSSLCVPDLVLVPKNSPQRALFVNTERFLHASFYHPSKGKLLFHCNKAGIELKGVVNIVNFSTTTYEKEGEVASLGMGPKESAIEFIFDGIGLRHSENDECFLGVLGSTPNTGMKVSLFEERCPKASSDRSGQKMYSKFCFNRNRTISLHNFPDLVIGIASPQLILVSRDSPCRFIFKDLTNFKGCPDAKADFDCMDDNDKLPFGSLISHPNYAIINGGYSQYVGFNMNWLGVGPIEKQRKLEFYRNRIRSSETGRGVLLPKANMFCIGNPCGLVEDLNSSIHPITALFRIMGLNDWVINKEGSLSPKFGRHLCLGAAAVGCANEILSEQLLLEANEEARWRPSLSFVLFQNTLYWCRLLVVYIMRFIFISQNK